MKKKIISSLICFSLVFSPTVALASVDTPVETFSPLDYNYDFSDEAQEKFNQNTNVYQPVTQYQPVSDTGFSENTHKYKKSKEKKQKTEEHLEEIILPELPPQQIAIPKYDPNAALQGSVVFVPEGTSFDIQLQSGISSGSLDENDKLTAVLPSNWIYNGNLIAPAGSLVYGTATDTTPAGYAYGSGAMELTFDRIMTPDGQMYNISAEKIRFENKSERGKKMTRDVLIGAGAGILVGLLMSALGANCYGCSGSSRSVGESMLIYGAAGAAGGGIKGAASRGTDVQVAPDTVLQLKLLAPLQVTPQNLETKLPNTQEYVRIE